MRNEIIKVMNVKWSNRDDGYYPFSLEELYRKVKNYTKEVPETLDVLVKTGFIEEVIIPIYKGRIEYDFLTTDVNCKKESFEGMQDPDDFEEIDVFELELHKFYRLK